MAVVVMTPEETKQFAHQLVHAWNTHDLEQILIFYSPEYEGLDVGRPGPLHGLEALRQSFSHYFQAFPNVHIEINELVVEADHLSLGWTAKGTQLGIFMKIPPTGRMVILRGVSLFIIDNRKVYRGQHIWDLAGLLRNVGLLPDL
jgi:steroid delta-isomerase-like uncharacterized protein